jgi:hypothetical protein
MDRRILLALIGATVAIGLTVAYLMQPEPEQTIDMGRDISRPGD